MSRSLRVVAPGEASAASDMTMTEAIQELCAKLIAARPVTVLVAYEEQPTKEGPGRIVYATLPQSFALAAGYAGELYNSVLGDKTPLPESE